MNEEYMTIAEAGEYLKVDRHNIHGLIRQGVLKDAGMLQTIGQSFRRCVTRTSVEKYKNRKIDLDDGCEVFQMRLNLSLYEAVCKGDDLTDEQRDMLQQAFLAATNKTVQGRLYRKLGRTATVAGTSGRGDCEVDPGPIDLSEEDWDDGFGADDEAEDVEGQDEGV